MLMNDKRLHPKLEQYLNGTKSPFELLGSLQTITPESLRVAFSDLLKIKVADPLAHSELRIENKTVETTVYGEIPIRTYRPAKAGILPIFIYFHGGGFVAGSIEGSDSFCRALVCNANCQVISVGYPLAPEYRFPIPTESSYEVVTHIYNKLNPQQAPIFLGGESAGANIAAVLCLMLRNRGGVKVAGQILIYPMTDTSFDSPSFIENANSSKLSIEHIQWFVSRYVRDDKDYENPYIAPVKSESVVGLPKALIVTADLDPLRDQGRVYARRLRNAGVDVVDICYEGMVHGFAKMPIGGLDAREDLMRQIKMLVHKSS